MWIGLSESEGIVSVCPLLHPPDLNKPFVLWTDASQAGFGALLEQEGENKRWYPIAYASRQTNPADRKYAPTELEVAALVFAVEHFEVETILLYTLTTRHWSVHLFHTCEVKQRDY